MLVVVGYGVPVVEEYKGLIRYPRILEHLSDTYPNFEVKRLSCTELDGDWAAARQLVDGARHRLDVLATLVALAGE